MKYITLALRWLITIPLEVVKTPLLFILHWASLFFALGVLITGFLWFYTEDIRMLKPILSCCLASSGSAALRYGLILFARKISPLSEWMRNRHEAKYFDQQYRLCEYIQQRRFAEIIVQPQEKIAFTPQESISYQHQTEEEKLASNYLEKLGI